MADVFLKIVNMSISACWIVLAIILLRFVLKKAPKWINCILWGIAGLRLVLPFSFESVFSLIPSAETISQPTGSPRPYFQSGINVMDNQVNGYLQEYYSEGITRPTGNFMNITTILSVIWVVGIVALLVYTLVSFLRLKSKIGTAVLLRDNIYQSEAVASPFVLGIIKPKIFLPFNISDQDMEHVIAHEQAHLRRKDHLWKPIGFLILTLHWFNPLVWLGYVLLCRDIELACDEKVVKELNNEQRADYSQALLTCSVNRRLIAACPLAFGEVGVKNRVKSVLNYKKPVFWIIVVAIIVSIVTAICFLTNPLDKSFSIEPESNYDIYEIEKHYYDKVVGADIANESNGYYDIAITKDMVLYKYFKAQGGNFDNSWVDIGKLVKQEDTAVIETLIKDKIPVKYKLLSIKEFYVVLDESEIQSASCVIIMKNGDVLFAEIPAYKTENRYVSNLMKLKIKKSEIHNGTYKFSNEIYSNGSFSYIPNFENDRIEIKTVGGMHIYHFTGEELSTGALYEEIKLNNENFSDLFDNIEIWSDNNNHKDLLKNNKKAWYHNTPDNIGGYPYMLLLQKDGTLCMIFADFENGEPTRVRYIYELEYTGNVDNGFNEVNNLSTEKLKEKYPQFFNVSTDGGLTVHIWQMAENSYSCYLVNTGLEALSDNSFAYEVGASIAEMRSILTTYDIERKDITIQPVINPLSSYHYEIDDTYRSKIKELFWEDYSILEADSNYSPIIDTATFDIDGDGKDEHCVLTYGPTSGLYTIVFTATEVGMDEAEYINTFNMPYTGGTEFYKSSDGKLKIKCANSIYENGVNVKTEDVFLDIEIENGNISLKNGNESIEYWGEQGITPSEFSKKLDVLENAVSEAVLKENKGNYVIDENNPEKFSDAKSFEAHEIMYIIKDDEKHTLTVYAFTLYEEFNLDNGSAVSHAAVAAPVEIVFDIKGDTEYKLKKYRTLEKNEDIKDYLPEDHYEYDDAEIMENLRQSVLSEANRYYGYF